jgi:hypothetical protein
MKKVLLWMVLLVAGPSLWAAPRLQTSAFKPDAPTPDQYLQAPRDGTHLLLLGAIFDPTVQEPDFSLVGLPAGVDPAYGIVQLKPGRLQAKRELQSAVTFVGYLPDNAFQVRLTARARTLLAGHEAVRWLGPYKAGYKVHPRLWPGSDETSNEVTVSLFPDASLDAIRAALAARVPGASLLPVSDLTSRRLRYAMPLAARAAFVAEAARLSGVALIEPYLRPVPNNNDALGPIQSNVPSTIVGTLCTTCSIFNHGLTGTGQIAAVADSGNDSDMCFFRYDGAPGSVTDAQSPAPPGTGTIDPTHKMIAYYVQPGATPYDDAAFQFHGTHTSGTVAGDNYLNLSGPLAPGIDVGDGMAPNAKLVFQDVSSATVFGAGLGDSYNMFLQASTAGARVHSNSYGAPTGGAYSGDDSTADRFLFDHEDMAIFISAGNDGPGANTIGSPGNAKNAVTVGALNHGNSTTIASFSSRGPTDDGRIKPDIMAPGVQTRSALGDASHTSDNCGTQAISGTSMSCPTTAGGAVLLRQYFADGYYPSGAPNPADALGARAPLVKAVLLNGTLPLPAGGPFGGFNFGWGRIFLDNNAFFTGDGREMRVWNVANTDGLQTGGSVTHQVTVGAGEEFRAALVWSDAEGSPGAGAILVNNLNLTVSDGTNTYLGNVFDPSGGSIPGGTADVINNVELVRLAAPVAATYTLTIDAPAVPGNGRAGTDRQGYALVVSYAACDTTVTTAPTGLAAADHPPMGVDLTWTSAPASAVSQVYRAVGDCSAPASDFQFIGATSGSALTDTRAQGGVTYAYNVRGADGCGEGPPSTCVSITPTGICDVVPTFEGIASAVGGHPTGTACNVHVTWEAGTSNCPLGPNLTYNIYRSTTPDFTPGPANLVASVTTTSYDDNTVQSNTTYFYAVRAEDSTTAGSGPHGGNEENNNVQLFATALGPPGPPGTFVDGAGDGHAYGTPEPPWQITTAQAQTGSFSYHPGPDVGNYPPGACAALTTPALSLAAGATLSYFARYNIEHEWDGTVVEISTDGGASWSDLPPAGGYPAVLVNGGNACGYPTTQGAFSGPPGNGALTPWAQYTTDLSAFAGQTVRIRWRFTSDGGVEFQGFYLDDIQITNVNLPGACIPTGTGLNGLSINNAAVTEGNGGTTTASFTIFLFPSSAQTVTVDFATADGSATTADNDYQSASGTATFPPGSTSQPVSVTVVGDTKFEGNETFFVNLSNPTGATIGDAQGQGTIVNDDGVGGGSTFVSELFHGYTEQADLASTGGAQNADFYSISQKPLSSYEVLVDATSGDIGPTLEVDRIGADGTTVVSSSVPTGPGFSRSLRWTNTTSGEVNTETVRVRSGQCTTGCGADDVYQIHAFETTYSVPRFNNAGTQITVLLLQNPTNYDINGTVYFWNTGGGLVGSQAFTLTAKEVLVLNTAGIAPGVGGAITVANDGRYGDLSGKTVALEPATGFSFDSPMLPRVKVN